MNNLFLKTQQGAFFIAEIGLNHNGDFECAERMIHAAAQIGVHAVKFQVFMPEYMNSIYTKSLLESGRENADNGTIDFFRQFVFSKEQLAQLKTRAEKLGVLFFSSVFDEMSLALLEELDVPLYKIASSEITNLPLLEHIAKTGKPAILSTGISTEEEIGQVIDRFRTLSSADLSLLHCVSLYPLKDEYVNLKRIISLKERFHLDVGFSDHTDGIHACAFAACLGARVFEKHFTIDASWECPDKAVSLAPDRFKEMMDLVEGALRMLGHGAISYGKEELHCALAARRSLFARHTISEGDIIHAEDLIALRPGVGIQPNRMDEIVGKRAKRFIKKEQMIREEYYG